MKCSDCKLWRTEDCRNNPGGKNLNYAETYACFELDPDEESRQRKAASTPQPLDARVSGGQVGDEGDWRDWPLVIGSILIFIGLAGILLASIIWLSLDFSYELEALALVYLVPILGVSAILTAGGCLGVGLVNLRRKGSIPLKTKVSIVLIIVIGIVGIYFVADQSGYYADMVTPVCVLYILPGIYLLLKEKFTWIIAVALLLFEMIVLFYYEGFFDIAVLPAYLVPFILVLLDTRRYWAIRVRSEASPDELDEEAEEP